MRGSGIPSVAPPAQLTLRAHTAAPARVELIYNPRGGRALRTGVSLIVCWGAIPFLLWVPPHYPWIVLAFFGGLYLAHRSWTGRFTIRSFAGICPRCGSPLALGVDRTVDLPHTLTCFHCHFEPMLEVSFGQAADFRSGAGQNALRAWRSGIGKGAAGWASRCGPEKGPAAGAGATGEVAIRPGADAESTAGTGATSAGGNRLEDLGDAAAALQHQLPDCVGSWQIRWLADEPFLYCERCHGGTPATSAARAAAERERRTAELLERLADEGKPLI